MSKYLVSSKSVVGKLFSFGRHRLSKLLLSMLVTLIVGSTAQAAGLLRVNPTNPRYFIDSNGTPVYLAGTYPAHDQIELGVQDFSAYLDFLKQQNHNFTRLWAWQQTPLAAKGPLLTLPYERTGPGLALDGGAQFDLRRLNQDYFDQLRARVVQAAQRGVYVSVVLFQSLNVPNQLGNPWNASPFNRENNVNHLDGDTNGDGVGDEAFTLAISAITSFQQAYIRKVVDTIGDLDNILYEISGDGLLGNSAWQYHIINYLKSYEATKFNQHPVGIGYQSETSTNTAFNSPADWIAVYAAKFDPPLAVSGKLLFRELNPRLLVDGSSSQSVWKSFTRGYNLIYKESDSFTPGVSQSLHAAISQSLGYSQFLNLSAMTPSDVVCSSGYCLAKPGAEYFVYLPSAGRVSVNLSAARQNFLVNWFDPRTGKTAAGNTVGGGGQVTFTSPFADESVLRLLVQPQASSQVSVTSNNGTPLTTSSLAVTSASNTLSATGASPTTTVSTPTMTPNGASFAGSISVSLAVATSGATIYYTTDGLSPTQSSKKYSGPITISTDTMLKAKAFKTDANPSTVASAWFAKTSNTSPVIGGSNLVGYWKFDEGTGTTAADASGNGNNGTLVNGPVRAAGIVGNALYFDGADDNVTVLDAKSTLDLSNSFTLSAWVNPAAAFTDPRTILAKNYKYYLYASHVGYCGDGTPLGGFYERTNQTVCQPSPLPVNTWTHFSLTYTGSTLTLYRNGVAIATSTPSESLSRLAGNLQIGANQYGEYFRGLIDEVRIYNRALTNIEIQTIYQQDSGNSSQTVATPVISPSGGTYSNSLSLTIQTATTGASIYYTTDGSTPTQASILYTGAKNLSTSATVRAKAFKSGYNASAEANATFAISSTTSNVTWTYCASEGGQCNFTGTKQVRYGDRGYYAYRIVINGIACNNEVFGDPLVGFGKACEYSNSTTTQSTSITTSTTTNPFWTFCAYEGSPCNFSGTKEVRYGANSAYVSKVITSGAYCDNSVFGDPVVGAGKVCEYRDVSTGSSQPFDFSISPVPTTTAISSTTTAPLWTFCAYEGSPCNFSGTKEVRYGANSAYVSKVVTSGVYCDNSVFGDPVVGAGKVCEYRDVSTGSSQPFDFSISNSGNQSVSAGSSATNSIGTTLISGISQVVSFSVSGLPSGATGSFSSPSCTLTCSTVLTIGTSGSTPAGSYPITVTSAGGVMKRSTVFTLSVTLVLTVATPTPSAVAAASITNSLIGTIGTGKTYYVATTGRDSNSGTLASPLRTPANAANIAQPGDTVYIRGGTYSEFAFPRSGSSGAPITFKNYPGEIPTIQGSSNSVQTVDLSGRSYIIVDGIRVVGGENGILVYGNGSNNQILNCEVTRGYTSGIVLYGAGVTDNLVKGNKVYDNSRRNWPRGSSRANNTYWGAGITVAQGSSNNIVEDNYVYWNHGEGINTHIQAKGTIIRRNVSADNVSVNIYVDGSTNVTIEGNFVYLSDAAKTWSTGNSAENNALGIGASIEPYGGSNSLDGLKVVNNFVVNTLAGFYAFKSEPGHPYQGWIITGNTFVNNDSGVRMENSGGTISNNTIAKNTVFQGKGGWVFQTDVTGSNTYSNNTYYGVSQIFYWGSSLKNLSGWISSNGETGSSWTDPILVNPSAPLPRFWSDASVPSPSPIVPLDVLVAPYRKR